MNPAFPRYLAAVGAVTALAAACSSGTGPVTRSGPPASASSPAASSASATAPSSSAAPSGTPSGTASPAKQRLTVTPATGLAATQTVLVQAAGFSPGELLVVTECADKGTATGPGDCDLTSMQSVTADASGQVKVQFTVHKGPFGTNKITCGSAQACLVSVNQPTPSPTEQASMSIKFR